ncbi:hypothetical protein DMR_40540 [Solidesulfovibrio magneticus RS-1]|uniref:Fe-S oxidoreductase n=1 Tax=Solidesulfovibrio magneticus (strain ATCC 700980 / DSM 13731 / RS-1) TaxID=573370 RepID=C4XP45_SOLM1|nr:hypothetical protein DMR_40540 [Solidesulfovibrio magneticus RS-1]
MPDFPLNVDVEFSAICNLKCARCPQRDIVGKIPLGVMEYGLFTDIINEISENGACAIKSCLRGEPFMQPRIFDMIEYAKDKGILDIILTTNATLLDEKMIDDILKSSIAGLAISVDTHHSSSFETKGKEYSEVENHINMLLSKKKLANKNNLWVRIQTNIESNGSRQELISLKETVKKQFPLADMFMVGRLLHFNPDLDPYPDTRENYKDVRCNGIFHRFFITWDGKILPCALDYQERMVLGHVGKDSLSSVWLSSTMMQLREKHLAHEMDEYGICRHCHFRFTPKEKDIFTEDGEEHSKSITGYLLQNNK